MDWKQVAETGKKAMREKLQRKGLDEIVRIAEGFGIPLPDRKWFSDPKQNAKTRVSREVKYKQGIIDEIVKRDFRI
jgi:hypothetical protein